MESPINRRERKKLQVQKTIVDIAMRVFTVKGFEETTVAEIMEEADLGTGTFYNYFQSKEEILKYVLTQKIAEVKTALEQLQNSPVESSQKLSELLMTVGLIYEQNKTLFGLYMKYYRDNRQGERTPPHGPVFKEILVSIIREGQEKGQFRDDIPLEVVMEMFMGIIQSSMTSKVEVSLSDNLKYRLALFLEGLTRRCNREEC